MEGGLAVAEEDGLPADRQPETLGPVGDVLLGDGRSVEHGLVAPLVRELVPPLPAGLLDARIDREPSHGLDDVDRALAEPVEVTREERVRAAQLAGAALGAVHVVLGHVLDAEMAAVHRHDVCVEGGRGVPLVAGYLHHRAHLAAELVPRAEAVVRGAAPFLEQRRLRTVGAPVRRRRGRAFVLRSHPASVLGEVPARFRDCRALGYMCRLTMERWRSMGAQR